MLETKDMVLCCHDYGLMQKLSKVLVKEHDTKYSSKSVVEYCIMNNEPIDYTCLYKEFINYYTFYALSDNCWDYTRSFLACDNAESVRPSAARTHIADKAVGHNRFSFFEEIAEVAVVFDYNVPFSKVRHRTCNR